jgi:hypothetical protein
VYIIHRRDSFRASKVSARMWLRVHGRVPTRAACVRSREKPLLQRPLIGVPRPHATDAPAPRRSSPRNPQVMQKRALEHPKITVLWDSVVEEAYGNERVSVRAWGRASGAPDRAAVRRRVRRRCRSFRACVVMNAGWSTGGLCGGSTPPPTPPS